MEPLLALLAVIVVLIFGRRYLKSHQAPATNEEAHPISLVPSTSGRDSTPAEHPERPPKAGLAAGVPACIVRSQLVINCDHCGKPACPGPVGCDESHGAVSSGTRNSRASFVGSIKRSPTCQIAPDRTLIRSGDLLSGEIVAGVGTKLRSHFRASIRAKFGVPSGLLQILIAFVLSSLFFISRKKMFPVLGFIEADRDSPRCIGFLT
jgi:hypothetical protein